MNRLRETGDAFARQRLQFALQQKRTGNRGSYLDGLSSDWTASAASIARSSSGSYTGRLADLNPVASRRDYAHRAGEACRLMQHGVFVVLEVQPDRRTEHRPVYRGDEEKVEKARDVLPRSLYGRGRVRRGRTRL
jgi:hypothetical protein